MSQIDALPRPVVTGGGEAPGLDQLSRTDRSGAAAAPTRPTGGPPRPVDVGRTRQAQAAQSTALPEPGRREALRAELRKDQVKVASLRTEVGPHRYATAAAANLLDRVQTGATDLRSGLREMRALRDQLPAGDEKTKRVLVTLDSVERAMLSNPLHQLQGLAVSSGHPDAAAKFDDFSLKLDQAMDLLRLGDGKTDAATAQEILMDLQASALADDSLYAELPSGQADQLRADLSSSLQTLLVAGQTSIDLSSDESLRTAGQVALSNALFRAAESAVGEEFDADAFKEILRPALQAAAGQPDAPDSAAVPSGFAKELAALEADPLTAKDALNLVFDLRYRLAGADFKGLVDRAGALEEKAFASTDSQFSRSAVKSPDFTLRPPKAEPGPFAARLVEAGQKLIANPGDQQAQDDIHRIQQGMGLLNLEPLTIEKHILDTCASARQTAAGDPGKAPDTETLADTAMGMRQNLAELEDGPSKTLLQHSLAVFDTFRGKVAESVTAEIDRRVDAAEELLSGSPDPETIKETIEGLTADLARALGDRRTGNTLGEVIKAKVQKTVEALELKQLDAELARLGTPRAGTPTMAQLAKTSGLSEEGKARLDDFSKRKLKELSAEIAALKLPDPPGEHSGRTASASLSRLEGRIDRLLLPDEADKAKAELTARRKELSEAAGAAAFERVKPEITSALSETERTNLRAVLNSAFGSGALVGLINAGSVPDPATAKALASLADLPAKEMGRKVDELLLGSPELDGAALDIKLALSKEGDHEDLKAAHVDSRLKRQSLALIREGGGQDLLDVMGLDKPEKLDFKRLTTLIADSLTDGDKSSPTILASNFNTLLVQTAWSAFQRENGLSGTPEDLARFIKELPEPLSKADPEVIKGMFELGPVSGGLLRRVAGFTASGAETLARADVGRLMDRMADHNPALKARRAMTTMLRNMLSSASIEYDPISDSAGAYASALKEGITRRAEHQPLKGQAADMVKRAVGRLSEASGLTLTGQIDAAMGTVQGLTDSLDEVRRLEADVASALKELENVHDKTRPTAEELKALKLKPGEKSSEDPKILRQQLADPWRFLVHQEALDPATGTIDGSKVRGEKVALGILAFRDVLKGNVEGLTTTKEKHAALKSLDIPRFIKFKYMMQNPSDSKLDDESKIFSNALDSIRSLNPDSEDFEKDFKTFSDLITKKIDDFGLDRKAELILIHKDSSSAVRHNETSGATASTTKSDVTTFGDSVKDKAKEVAKDLTVGQSSAVMAAAALERGLEKVALTPDKTGEAGALRKHFLTGPYLAMRGQAPNLLEAERRAAFDARKRVEVKQALLEEGMSDFSSRSEKLLREATRLSALEAVSELGYTSFEDAEKSLQPGSKDTRLRDRIEENLEKNFGIKGPLAHVLVEAEVVKPIQIGQLKSEAATLGSTLESFCQEARPSSTVRGLTRKMEGQLAEPIKQLVQAETQRRRFDSILGQLEPGKAMDFTSGLKVGVQAGAVAGPVKVTGAAELARDKGVSLGLTDAGVYQLSLKGGWSGGVGVGASAEILEAGVEVGVGLKAKKDECLTLDFRTREDAAQFLSKMTDKTLTPEDVHRHCSNIQVSDTIGGGVAASVTVEVAKVPIMDGSKLGGTALFTAGFEASGNLERKVEHDTKAETFATTTATRGRLGISLTVGKAEEESEGEDKVDLDEDLEMTMGAIESAGTAGLEIGDETRGVFGKGVALNASAKVEDKELKCELSVTGNKSNTITRSSKSDSRNRLEGAAQNVALEFTGTFAQTQFGKYARDNLGVAPALVETMIKDIGKNGTPFTLEATRTLKPEILERCRELEKTGTKESNEQVEKLLGDDNNYELDSVKLVFGGRTESESSDHSLNMGFAKLSVARKAEGKETTTVEYKSENGVLKRLP
jgi:hypothetical protein